MKQRRVAIYTCLVLFVLLPAGVFMRAYLSEQSSHSLIEAIQDHDVPVALDALNHGADPNARDYYSTRTLSLLDRVLRLFEKMRGVGTAHNDYPPSALLLAAENSYARNYAPVDTNGRMRPVLADSVLVTTLLEKGADPNSRTDSDYVEGVDTPLLAAATNGDVECARLLIKHGADVNMAGATSITALMQAVAGRHAAMVLLLLNARADVNARNERGLTAIALAAATSNNEDCLRILKEAGAKP